MRARANRVHATEGRKVQNERLTSDSKKDAGEVAWRMRRVGGMNLGL